MIYPVLKRLISRLIPASRFEIGRLEKKLMSKLNELAGNLTAVVDTLEKVKGEVTALKDSLTNVELPPDAQAALDKLVATSAALDALNPDAPAPEPVEMGTANPPSAPTE
jgi:hypothetical protein